MSFHKWGEIPVNDYGQSSSKMEKGIEGWAQSNELNFTLGSSALRELWE